MASRIWLVVIFNVIAFSLAVAAELRRSTATVQPDSEFNYNYCVYNSGISTWYGVGAMLFVMASQLLIMVSSQCFCCGKALKLGGSRACAVLLFITCWMFSITAEVWLLAASVTNAHQTKYRTIFGAGSADPLFCQTMRKGVFAAGAAFIFLNCIVSELYYVCFSKAREISESYEGEAGIALIE
ncbi:hypothetical protein RHGRI_009607 [Rhododendron griersonianum]|uniref:Fiber protein Fb34 n=2 Tax=Rhododendron TaxID=4346 RepID=A0AAV6KFC4_9ERIC